MPARTGQYVAKKLFLFGAGVAAGAAEGERIGAGDPVAGASLGGASVGCGAAEYTGADGRCRTGGFSF
jgi:hypothetical protein